MLLLLSASPARAAVEEEPEPTPQLTLASPESDGANLLRNRKWTEAAIVLKTQLRRNPGSAPVALDLAKALAFAGRREEALNVLNQALSRQRPGATHDELERRIRVLSRLFLNHATFQAYQDGVNILAGRKFRLARERFEKALEQEPDNVEILLRIGQCQVLEGDSDSAAERLRVARRLDPFEPEISLWLGRALYERGERAAALEELKRAASGLSGSELAPMWLADLWEDIGQHSRALQLLENDLRDHPLHVRARMELAGLEVREGGLVELQAARRQLQAALVKVPQYVAPETDGFESELGVDLRPEAADLRAEIEKSLGKLEGRARSAAD